jgi:hypothetical protein
MSGYPGLVCPGKAKEDGMQVTRAGHANRRLGLALIVIATAQLMVVLAALGTVAWTAVANSIRSQAAIAAAAAGRAGVGRSTLATAHAQAVIYRNALAAGITRGFLTASGIALAAFVIAVVFIRVRREDLAGPADPATGAQGHLMGTLDRPCHLPHAARSCH